MCLWRALRLGKYVTKIILGKWRENIRAFGAWIRWWNLECLVRKIT